jgi:hypothetical protein
MQSLPIVKELILPLLSDKKVYFLDSTKSAETISADFVVCSSSNISIELSSLNDYEIDFDLSLIIEKASVVDDSCIGIYVLKRKEKQVNSFSKQAVITWISGEKFYINPSLDVFHNSLIKSGFNGRKIVFTNDMDLSYRKRLIHMGYEIIDVNPYDSRIIVRDRFLAWYKFLIASNLEFVYLLDVKDVVFQSFPKIDDLEKIFLISEGKTHSECSWNIGDQAVLQKRTRFTCEFLNWNVLCGGTIFGNVSKLKNFLLQIWTIGAFASSDYGGSDQAIMNYLYHNFFKNDSDFKIIDPRISSLVATADLPYDFKPIFKNGKLFHPTLDEPYSIWHQWDRTEQKNQILEKYT